MKHKFVIGAMLLVYCFTSQNLHAQLEVQSSNNVKISKWMSIRTNVDYHTLLNLSYTSNNNTNTWYGIKSHMKTGSSVPTGPIISLYGFADASLTTTNYPVNTIIGVFGRAQMNQYLASYFSAGVAGVASQYGGVGVYGTIINGSSYSFPTTSLGVYAGYFAGNVKVTGTLTASSVTTTSDMRLKENIQDLNQSAAKNIQLLRPVEYKLKPDSIQHVYQENAFEMKVNHYGLLAQEVQEVFPNIVYEGQDGYMSINYTELIPVLIKSVQDLSAEVTELKAQIKELQTKKQ